MQTIKLETSNHYIFNAIMDFLNTLPQRDFKVEIEKQSLAKNRKKLKAISLKTRGFKFDREEANAR